MMFGTKVMFALITAILMANGISASKPGTSPPFLGTEISKAYYFPWMTSIHYETDTNKELIGTGSIIAVRWIVGSLDCFVKRSKTTKKPYYDELKDIYVYSGDVWATPLNEKPSWLQKRRIIKFYVYSDTDMKEATVLEFERYNRPEDLHKIRRSPFGFGMSAALMKMVHPPLIPGDGKWLWKRGTLPIPLFSGISLKLATRTRLAIEDLEEYPFQSTCYVAGWRKGDGRLVQYQVMYVPLDQCQSTYCSFDHSACGKWPVRGVHVCFKALTHGDLCWTDQGSALFCQDFDNSVLAVLTSAPTCGYGGLPGVYTLMSIVASLFEKVSLEEPYRPIADLFKYLPPPKEKLLPAYYDE